MVQSREGSRDLLWGQLLERCKAAECWRFIASMEVSRIAAAMGGSRSLRGCSSACCGRVTAAPGGRMLPQELASGPQAPRHRPGTLPGGVGGGFGGVVAETHLGLGLRPSASRFSSRRARRSMAW